MEVALYNIKFLSKFDLGVNLASVLELFSMHMFDD